MEVNNHYTQIPEKYKQPELNYPNKDKIQIKLPAMINIVGSTGSGKTNVCVDLIEKINNFDRIYLYAKDLKEPIYAWMIDKFLEVQKKTNVQVLHTSDSIKNMMPINEMERNKNNLVIIDDMICEKKGDLKIVSEYFIRARKVPATCIFISQSYYDTPILIRKNTNYLIFKRINTKSDLKSVLNEYSLGVELKTLASMYDYSTSGAFTNFFMIDLVGDKSMRFRKCYTPIKWSNESNPDVPNHVQPKEAEWKGKEIEKEASGKKRRRGASNNYNLYDDSDVEGEEQQTERRKKKKVTYTNRIPSLY